MSSPHDCLIAPRLRRQSRYPPRLPEPVGESAGTPAPATAALVSGLARWPGTMVAGTSTLVVSAASLHWPRSTSTRIAPATKPASSPRPERELEPELQRTLAGDATI